MCSFVMTLKNVEKNGVGDFWRGRWSFAKFDNDASVIVYVVHGIVNDQN